MKFKSAHFVLIIEIIAICIFHAVKISNETKPLKNQVQKLVPDKKFFPFHIYSSVHFK